MSVSSRELADGLRAVLGRRVELEERRPCPYGSSVPLEEVRVDGEWMIFKDLSPAPRSSRPAFMVDPLREVEVYRHGLAPGAPELRGALVDERRAWLFLERVDGMPLWQSGDPGDWEAAARWLAALHSRALPAGESHLIAYNADWLARWAARALGVPSRVRGAAGRAAERLARLPAVLVHGEFYPSNILVSAGRIRPVDWETAGIGPGVLDLAALTSGRWSPEERDRLELAYRDALPADRRPAHEELAAASRDARLLVAVQWLGWQPGFVPPPEHAHDWLADAVRLAEEVDR